MKFYAPKYKQLDLGLLRSSLDELDKTNRWVALGDLLPWTELEKEYNSRLDNQKKGAGNKPARMILSEMIIKHKLNLSDAETIEIIRESPYMQYFCELHEFTDLHGSEHKGVLKIDATCADAEMCYPVDVDIIHDGCRKVTDYAAALYISPTPKSSTHLFLCMNTDESNPHIGGTSFPSGSFNPSIRYS